MQKKKKKKKPQKTFHQHFVVRKERFSTGLLLCFCVTVPSPHRVNRESAFQGLKTM